MKFESLKNAVGLGFVLRKGKPFDPKTVSKEKLEELLKEGFIFKREPKKETATKGRKPREV